ncbi:MAG: DUF1732 domain-containing protein [Bacteroidetes bacterium]|nr:DUF1732 domain-containing protein [Bacteroidota bacterium]
MLIPIVWSKKCCFISKNGYFGRNFSTYSYLHYFNELLEEQWRNQLAKNWFVAQKWVREINTLGAKANDANLQRLVVDMKDELEKIKEQNCKCFIKDE